MFPNPWAYNFNASKRVSVRDIFLHGNVLYSNT